MSIANHNPWRTGPVTNRDVWGMNDLDRQIADEVYGAMMESQLKSDRAMQAQQFRVGVSDLGYCSERLRRFLDRQEGGTEPDMLAAFMGTWLGSGIEHAFKAVHPEAVIQSEVTLHLRGETNSYEVPGHPDIIWRNMVLDAKTSMRLAGAARHGFEDDQKRFQRHMYGLAAWEAGLLGEIALDEVLVGNIWLDRSAQDKELLVRTEPLDLEVIDEAIRWLDQVVYSWQHGEEAQKEPAREVCETTCLFYRECRAFDTDVSGLITDEKKLDAVNMYVEGGEMKKRGTALQEAAKDELDGVVGSTGTHSVRWVHISPTFGEKKRAGYSKLQISELK